MVTKHIRNVYIDSELNEKATCAKFAQVQIEGKRKVERFVEHYDLDMIISVGYRFNSKTATQFRQWATKTLRQHITEGYTVNRTRIAKNYDTFMKAVGNAQRAEVCLYTPKQSRGRAEVAGPVRIIKERRARPEHVLLQ